MRHTHYLSIALAASLLPALLYAARRPHYGGTLRIETVYRAGIFGTLWGAQVYENLVRSDAHGELQPALAVSWSHDVNAERWIFAPRKNVSLHNGSPWTPADGSLSFPDTKPLDQILTELALPSRAVMDGTGPFRITQFRFSEFFRLEASDGYWNGRPYLDAVEIQMGRPRRDELLDLELGKAEVVEAEVTDIAALRQKGVALEISKPLETIALMFDNANLSSDLRQAIALSIDRGSIQRVLLDKQGEPSAALLPRWISGYSFLFPATHDVGRARNLVHANTALVICEDPTDRVLRSVADRIAVDAAQAGVTVRSAGNCDAHLLRLPIISVNPRLAILGVAAKLHVTSPAYASPYEMESAFLRDNRIVPLFHLPFVYAMAPNVRNWHADGNLADVWLEESVKP